MALLIDWYHSFLRTYEALWLEKFPEKWLLVVVNDSKNKLYLRLSLYEDWFLKMFNWLITPAMKTNKRLLKLTDILFPLLMLCLGTRMILNWTGGEQGTIDTFRVSLYGLTEIVLIVVLLTYGIYLCVQQWRKYQQSQSKWRMASLFFTKVSHPCY